MWDPVQRQLPDPVLVYSLWCLGVLAVALWLAAVFMGDDDAR